MTKADDREVVTGAVQQSHYATTDNLAKRQSIFAYLDPARSRGGLPLERVPFTRGERSLDVGCGNGIWLGRVARTSGSAHVVGLDLSMAMAKATRSAVSHACVAQADAHNLPVRDGAFDAVLAMHMLAGGLGPGGRRSARQGIVRDRARGRVRVRPSRVVVPLPPRINDTLWTD